MAFTLSDLPGYTERFIGRDWVFTRIAGWLTDSSTNALLLTGPPGSGKSAIAAELVKLSARSDSDISDTLLPVGFLTHYHFCRARDGRSRNPLRFLADLATRLTTEIEGFGSYLLEHGVPGITIENSIAIQNIDGSPQITGVSIGALHVGTLAPQLTFDQMIARPLEELPVRQPILVLVDGLDEASSESENTFADLVKHMIGYGDTLPLRFILTARANAAAIIDRIDADTVNITDDEPPDVDDIFLYAFDGLRDPEHPAYSQRDRFASRLSSAASGNFLYAEFQLAAIRNDPQHWRETDLPESLHGAYKSFLQREIAPSRTDVRWTRRYRPILGLLAVARGDGLTPARLKAITRLSASDIEDSLANCGPFLMRRDNSTAVRIYHESFREFLIHDPVYHVFPDEAADSVVQHCMTALSGRGGATTDEYTLRYLVEHLQELGRHNEIIKLSLNDQFLESQDTLAPRYEMSLATREAGLRAALITQDSEHFAAIALAAGLTRDRIAKITPAQALATDGLAAALTTANALNPDNRTVWYLALAAGLCAPLTAVETSAVLSELLAFEPSALPQHWQNIAAVLLARTMTVDRAATLQLQEALLENWGRQHLVNCLIDAGCVDDAAQIVGSFSDGDIWLRALHAVAEEYFRADRAGEAIVMVTSQVADVPWVSEHLVISNEVTPSTSLDEEPEFLASLYAGVPAARTELFKALASDSADASRKALVIAARAAFYYHHIGDHDAESACLSFCSARTAKRHGSSSSYQEEEDEIDNGQSQAFAWVYLAETLFYLNRLPEARRFLRKAASVKPPLTAMVRQWGNVDATHDDPQHRFCLQGLTLRLSQAGARLGEPDVHRAAAQELMDLGSRDAVRALLADIEASAGDLPVAREKLDAALSWAQQSVSSGPVIEMQRLARSPVVASLPDQERLADKANAALLAVLEKAPGRDENLLFDCCHALTTVASTLGRNGKHGKSAQVIHRVRKWVTRLDQRRVLTHLAEQLALQGSAAEIRELLHGHDVQDLDLGSGSQIDDFILRTGDLNGAAQTLQALKLDGELSDMERLRELVTNPAASADMITEMPAYSLWLASRIAAKGGDGRRAELLREHALVAATKLAETHRSDQQGSSSFEENARAEKLAEIARLFAEMGLAERADETFQLASEYYWSAENSWDIFRFAFAGIIQTRDERAAERDISGVARIARRCNFIEGFAHSGHLDATQAHIDIIMKGIQSLETMECRDQALRRLACTLGYLGRWDAARNAVDSMRSGRDYAALRVLASVARSPMAVGAKPIGFSDESLMDIAVLGCRSLNGAILTCAVLGDGAFFPFDISLERSFDRVISVATAAAETVTGHE